jgi:hypothetical protein
MTVITLKAAHRPSTGTSFNQRYLTELVGTLLYIQLPSSLWGDSPTKAPQEIAEILCTIIK